MAQHPQASGVGGLWRRAVQALAHAFDPAREADGEDTVFQPGRARERAAPDERRRVSPEEAATRPPEETLQ
jgi:hypothetical protein